MELLMRTSKTHDVRMPIPLLYISNSTESVLLWAIKFKIKCTFFPEIWKNGQKYKIKNTSWVTAVSVNDVAK